MNKTKLIKLLSMIASEHDGEALSAARAAHRMITTAGLTWDKVILEPAHAAAEAPVYYYKRAHESTTPEYSPRWGQLSKAQKITCLRQIFAEFAVAKQQGKMGLGQATCQFIDGLENHLNRHGDLSDKQIEHLCQTYARVFERKARA